MTGVHMRRVLTATILLIVTIVTARVTPGLTLFTPALLVIPDTITGWRIRWHLRKLIGHGRTGNPAS